MRLDLNWTRYIDQSNLKEGKLSIRDQIEMFLYHQYEFIFMVFIIFLGFKYDIKIV
jgi:hypothetical protein